MRWLTRLTTAAVIAIAIAAAALAVRARIPSTHVGGQFRTYAMFRDASRLAVGAAVVIAGVQVGVIDRLTIEGDLARIDLRLRNGLELPADSFATRRADSLFGDSYIEIIPCCGEGSARDPTFPSPARSSLLSASAQISELCEIARSAHA